jgi:hypothetical protein
MVMMMVVMMVVVPLAKRSRRGDHRQEQDNGKNLLHKWHPSMDSISGWRVLTLSVPEKKTFGTREITGTKE